MNTFVVSTLLFFAFLVCNADVQLEQLEPNDLLLFNVAVKARLLEKLTEETERIQFERNELVNRHKSCLENVSSAAKDCKQCVVNKCVKRGKECQLKESELQRIQDEIANKSIPGVDFLSPPSVVQEEIREIKETAEDEIMEDVPQELKPKGKAIMQKVKEGMSNFHNNLERAVNTLPDILPQIEQNIADIGTNIDMDAVKGMADQAADEITRAINDPTFTGIRVNVINGNRVIKENLPSIMEAMGNTLSRFKSAVGNFIGVVRVQAGTAWKQATSNQTQNNVVRSRMFVLKGSSRTQNQIPNQLPDRGGAVFNAPNQINTQQFPVNDMRSANQINTQQFPANNMRFDNQINTQQFPANNMQIQQPVNDPAFQQQRGGMALPDRFPNPQPNQFQTFQQQAVPGRRKRQVKIPCINMKTNLYESCHSYHFYCQSCMNEKTILEHDCGRRALVAMVAIKELDIQTGNDIVKYKKFANKGQVVNQVMYDKNSLNVDTGTYSRAYITVQIDGRDKVFGTSILPDLQNIKHAGFKLGDELWTILQKDDKTPSTLHIKQSPEFHSVRTDFLKSEPPNSAAGSVVTGTLWGVIGILMYMGYVAISVMV